MTQEIYIRLDDKQGFIASDDKHAECGWMQATPNKDDKKQERYAVYFGGELVFRSNRMIGDRVNSALLRGIHHQLFCIQDTETGQIWSIANAAMKMHQEGLL